MRTPWLVVPFLAAAAPLEAQCPDGTPPPCGARRAVARGAVPASADRGRRFIVLPFRNLTGAADAAWLVEGSTTLLADALGQWRELTVVSDDRLYPALRRQGLTPGQVMDAARVRRVAEETGGWTAITGEVLATGGRLRFTARATDVVTGRVLQRSEGAALPSDDLRQVYRRLATGLAGVTPGSDAGSGGGTTASLDAYRAYVRGVGLMNRQQRRQALAAFQEAVALDSSYAAAWGKLALASLAGLDDLMNPSSDAYRAARRAEGFAANLPPRDRGVVRAIAQLFGGELGAARASLLAVLAQDSTDAEVLDLLADVEFLDAFQEATPAGPRRRGSLTASARYAKRAIEADPGRHGAYSTLTQLYGLASGLFGGLVATRAGAEGGSLAALLQRPPVSLATAVLESDSFTLVPLQTAAGWTPRELAARRAPARDAARAWLLRWIQAGPTESGAYQSLAMFQELVGQADSALAALERADSLGIQSSVEDVAVRRMVLLGKAGRVAGAARLADSLMAAGRFTRYLGTNVENEHFLWAFHLLLWNGAADRAGQLADQMVAAVRAAGPFAAVSIEWMLCEQFPPVTSPARLPAALYRELAPRLVPVAGRLPREGPSAACLSSILERAVDSAATPERGALLAAAADIIAARVATGDSTGGYRMAVGLLREDSSFAPRFDAPWYRERAAVDRISDRFRPVAAVAGESTATFTWRPVTAATYRWQRASSLLLQLEYRWRAVVDVDDRRFNANAIVVRRPGPAREGPLEQLVASATAGIAEVDSSDESLRALPDNAASVRVVNGEIELTVRGELAALMRGARSVRVRLRTQPCIPDPALPDPSAGCSVDVPLVRR